MPVSLSLHIIGIVMWLGSLLILTRLLTVCAEGQVSESLGKMSRKLYFGWTLGGLVLTLLTGLYQLIAGGIGYYMKAGWFHGKLTFLIVLLVVTVLLARPVNMVSRGENVHQKNVMALHGVTGLCLIVIVFLTMVGRAYM